MRLIAIIFLVFSLIGASAQKVVLNPSNYTVNAGSSITITPVITNTFLPSISWSRIYPDNVKISSDRNLTLNNLTAGTTKYRITVSNLFGGSTYADATVNVVATQYRDSIGSLPKDTTITIAQKIFTHSDSIPINIINISQGAVGKGYDWEFKIQYKENVTRDTIPQQIIKLRVAKDTTFRVPVK